MNVTTHDCNECGKSFLTKRQLSSHELTHEFPIPERWEGQ